MIASAFNKYKLQQSWHCTMYICAVGLLLLSKFTALQIFQDALLQRQSFVDGGSDSDDRNRGILEDGKEEK